MSTYEIGSITGNHIIINDNATIGGQEANAAETRETKEVSEAAITSSFTEGINRSLTLTSPDEQGNISRKAVCSDGKEVVVMKFEGTDSMAVQIKEPMEVMPCPKESGKNYAVKEDMTYVHIPDEGITVIHNVEVAYPPGHPDEGAPIANEKQSFTYTRSQHREVMGRMAELPMVGSYEDLAVAGRRLLGEAAPQEGAAIRQWTSESMVGDNQVRVVRQEVLDGSEPDRYQIELVQPIEGDDHGRQVNFDTITSFPGEEVLIIRQQGWQQWDAVAGKWQDGTRQDFDRVPDEAVRLYDIEADELIYKALSQSNE